MNIERQQINKSDYKLMPVIYAMGRGFLVGGYKEYSHQRNELKEQVDQSLPWWKQELEIIRFADKKQIIKTGLVCATLEAGREVYKQTVDSCRHSKLFDGNYSFA